MRRNFAKIMPGIFWGLAGLLMIYVVCLLLHCHSYIQTLIANGQLVAAENRFEILNYYLANCGVYAFHSFSLAGLGTLLYHSYQTKSVQLSPTPLPLYNTEISDSEEDTQDDTFSDWKISTPSRKE